MAEIEARHLHGIWGQWVVAKIAARHMHGTGNAGFLGWNKNRYRVQVCGIGIKRPINHLVMWRSLGTGDGQNGCKTPVWNWGTLGVGASGMG